jgi:hypothetical protein
LAWLITPPILGRSCALNCPSPLRRAVSSPFLPNSATQKRLLSEKIDVSLPGRHVEMGGLHPVTITLKRIQSLFVKRELLHTFDVKIIDEDIEGILWLEFAAKFSKCHFYVVVCYLLPADTCRPVNSEIFFLSSLFCLYTFYYFHII